MRKNKLFAIVTAGAVAAAMAVPLNVWSADTAENAEFSYDNCTFEEFLTYDAEEICGISEQAKTVYEDALADLAELTFDDSFSVNLSDEYETAVPYYTDPVTAREMIGDELKLDTSIYWGIVTPTIGDNTYPSVSVYLHPEEKLSLTEKYGLENNEFAAKTAVWISLSSNVESVSPRWMGPHPTGIDADTNYYTYEFDDIVNMDMKEIFDLVLHTPLIYVDALAYARENGFDQYTDLTDYSFIIKSTNLDNHYDPDNMTNAFKKLHIDAHWLKDGTIISRGDKQYQLIISDAFVNEHLNYGYDYDNITLFASIYFWLTAGAHVDDFSIEVNDEPDVNEIYTFDQFLTLSEEEVIAIHQQLAPDIDAAAECETVKKAAAAGMENNDLNLLLDVSMDLHTNAVWMGDSYVGDLFFIDLILAAPEMVPTYHTAEYDGAAYMEYRIDLIESEFEANSLEPADTVYKMCVWILAHSDVKAVRVEDTSYTSCGLTEEELYAKYTFDDIMKLSPEEICSFSEDIKRVYSKLAPAIDYLGFSNNIDLYFPNDYSLYLQGNEDLIAARQEVGEKLRLPDEIYWGMAPSYNTSIKYYTDIYLHEENLESMAQSYGLTVGDLVARLVVWMELNPDAAGVYGGYIPEGAAGGINPDILYDSESFSFDAIAEGTAREIYTLPFYSSLYYVDALIYARDNGFESAEDAYKQRFRVRVSKGSECFNDDGTVNHTELTEMLHIDASWLRGGCTDGVVYDDETEQYWKWLYLDIDEGFYDSYISAGCEYDNVFAAIYTWLRSDAMTVIEENASYTPPAVTHGEVNHDGKISLLDIISLSKYTADIVTYNSSQLKAADCTGDGIVDGNDLTALLMFIVNLVDTLPADTK